MKVAEQNTHMMLMSELYRAFDFFNEAFALELDRPVITIQSKGGRATLGWFSHDIWVKDGVKKHEINLCAEAFARPMIESIGTLVHEIAHMKNFVAGIVDCNDQQRHNRKFKEAAESLGMSCESRPGKLARFGTAFTELLPVTVAMIHNSLKPDESVFNLFRLEFNEMKKDKKKPKNPLVPVMLGKEIKDMIVAGAESLGITQKEFTTSAVQTMIAMPDNIKLAAAAVFKASGKPGAINTPEKIEDLLRVVFSPEVK